MDFKNFSYHKKKRIIFETNELQIKLDNDFKLNSNELLKIYKYKKYIPTTKHERFLYYQNNYKKLKNNNKNLNFYNTKLTSNNLNLINIINSLNQDKINLMNEKYSIITELNDKKFYLLFISKQLLNLKDYLDWKNSCIRYKYLLDECIRLGGLSYDNLNPILDLVQDVNAPIITDVDKFHANIPNNINTD